MTRNPGSGARPSPAVCSQPSPTSSPHAECYGQSTLCLTETVYHGLRAPPACSPKACLQRGAWPPAKELLKRRPPANDAHKQPGRTQGSKRQFRFPTKDGVR